MAHNDTQSAPGSRLHLLSLPQELQLYIFDFAYHRSPNARLVDKRHWRSEQRLQRRLAFPTDAVTNRPFPGCKVTEFMVSKQYFVAAARAYLSSQLIDVRDESNMSWATVEKGVLAEFTRVLSSDYLQFLGVPECLKFPNLKVLRLHIQWTLFEFIDEDEDEDLPILKEYLTAEALAKSEVSKILTTVRGLTRFELVVEDLETYHTTATEHEKATCTWKANMTTLEEIVRPAVTAVRSACPSATASAKNSLGLPVPLYARSKVFFEAPTDPEDAEIDEDAELDLTYDTTDMGIYPATSVLCDDQAAAKQAAPHTREGFSDGIKTSGENPSSSKGLKECALPVGQKEDAAEKEHAALKEELLLVLLEEDRGRELAARHQHSGENPSSRKDLEERARLLRQDNDAAEKENAALKEELLVVKNRLTLLESGSKRELAARQQHSGENPSSRKGLEERALLLGQEEDAAEKENAALREELLVVKNRLAVLGSDLERELATLQRHSGENPSRRESATEKEDTALKEELLVVKNQLAHLESDWGRELQGCKQQLARSKFRGKVWTVLFLLLLFAYLRLFWLCILLY